MPLIHSASKRAVSENIRRERAAGRPQRQAIAIALDVARRAGKANGGQVEGMYEDVQTRAKRAYDELMRRLRDRSGDPDNVVNRAFGSMARADGGSVPFYVRSEARGLEHAGMIHSPVAGRTDRLPMGVRANSYVIPADVVSSVGQGNSAAGAQAFDRLFKMGPYGSSLPRVPKSARPIRQRFADGGVPEPDEPVDIVAAGGEYIVDPDAVAQIGGGDMQRGHEILDGLVKQVRAKTIKTLRALPKPKKS